MRFLLVALMAACTGTPAEPPSDPEQVAAPDVLLVVLDTLRADATSTYGSPRPTTPQLDALAARGVRYADATSPASWTWPAHGSLFTGLAPWEHGAHFAMPHDTGAFTHGGDAYSLTGLHAEVPTLAERFAAAGYDTIALSANPMLTAESGMMRGFDRAEHLKTDEAVIQAASEVLATPRERPLLMFANLYGAHAPFDVQPVGWLDKATALPTERIPEDLRPWVFRERTRINFFRAPEDPADGVEIGVFGYTRGTYTLGPEARSLLWDVYQSEVMRVDFDLHQLIDLWTQARGDHTVVAVTSDHGEHLGEHQLMDHGRAVSPEVLHVPLVISAPGRLDTGSVEAPVSTAQLPGTLLQLAGLPTLGTPLPVPGTSPPETPVMAAAWPDRFWAAELGDDFTLGERWVRTGSRAVSQRGSLPAQAWQRGPHGAWSMVEPAEADADVLTALPADIFSRPGGAAPAMDPATRAALEQLGYLEPNTEINQEPDPVP